MNIINTRKEQGFSILAVILVIVAIIVAIGVWALSGESNTSGGTSASADLHAQSILNDATAVKSTFQGMQVKGVSNASVTFIPNTAGSTNLLDPTNGIAYPRANPNAIHANAVEPDGIFVYTNKFVPTGDSSFHPAILVAGLKDSVCQRINASQWGTTDIPKYTPYTNSNQFVQGASSSTPTNTNNIDFTSGGLNGAATQGWNRGCVSANGTVDQNLFFMMLDR